MAHWPGKIQPYIDAMLETEVPADISCDQAMAAAGRLHGAAEVFGSDNACRDSPKSADMGARVHVWWWINEDGGHGADIAVPGPAR